MSSSNYYTVMDDNAAMIAHSYHHARRCMDQYFRGFRYVKGFVTMREANKAAVTHLEEISPRGAAIPKQLELDKLYTARALRNREEDHHA